MLGDPLTPAEDGYRRILDTAPDAIIVVGPAGTIVYANAQVERLFGHSRDVLTGASIAMLLPARFGAAHAKHVTRFFGAPEPRSMGTGTELIGLRADGGEFPIEVRLSPVETKDGLLVSAAIRDVSDRRALEAEAKLLAARLGGAIEGIQDALAIYDAQDELVLCNSIFRGLLSDVLPGKLVGRPYTEILDGWLEAFSFPSETDRACYRADRLAERSSPKGTSDVRTKDGRNLRMTSRRTLDGGMVQTVWDLSADVLREEELQLARATAEAASASKSEFLASMSHELRTPLSAVLGFGQLLQRDQREPLSARHATRVDQIMRGGEHLLRLINDILDLSGIEAGRISISTEPVGVAEVLAQLRSTLEPMAVQRRVHVTVQPVDPTMPLVSVDRTRFAQILMNFGSNAVKYNRPGGAVAISVGRVGNNRVRVSVTDSGVGIPTGEHAKLFQPFHRAGQETGPIEGTGIGLAISKRLAALMQGEVGFSSQVGIGSTFWLDVPAHTQPLQMQAPTNTEITETRLSLQSQKVVLFVEDNPANVAFMVDLLSAFESIELVTAATAELGVGLAVTRQPATILMDINLPGMSGLDALRVLKSSPVTASIPVIALTAAASEKDRERGLAAGFYRYLTKPVQVDELLAALEAVLSSS